MHSLAKTLNFTGPFVKAIRLGRMPGNGVVQPWLSPAIAFQLSSRMKFLRFRILALLALLALCRVPAQAAPFWAENFTIPAVDGTVNAIAETADAFYYGGSFGSVGTVVARNVVRVDKATGNVTPLGSAAQNGTDSAVSALAVIGTDLYVGGSFTSVSSSAQNAISANRIARWDTAGGTWSPLGSAAQNGAGGSVNTLAVIGSDLYVGGNFNAVSSSTQAGISSNGIARWDIVGATWSPLGSAAQNGTNANVNALAASGTGLFVGGTFGNVSSSTQNAIAASSVARWDTTGGVWSPLGSAPQNGAGGIVNALAVNGTDVYVGGFFTTVSSGTQSAISANSAARWDVTANAWSPLGSATQNGANGTVNALAVSGTDLYVGGVFTAVSSGTQNAVAASRVAKWDTSGSTWALLGSASQNGTNNKVNVLAASGSGICVGGSFTSAGGIYGTSGIAKWSAAGSTWAAAVAVTAGDGIPGSVNAVLDAGSVVYVGGNFAFAGNVPASNVACWNKAARTWSLLGTASQNGTNGGVNSLVLIGTDLYVGGAFTTVSSGTQNAITANRVAKWDTIGGAWSPLGSATQNGTGSLVSAMAAMGTDLYVGGSFATVSSSAQNAISAKNIARWDTLGSTWSPLGSASLNGMFGQVKALAVDGTDLYVGGAFTTASSSTQSGISARFIAKWNTAANTWSPLGSAAQNGTNSTVNALVMRGASLFAGGEFTTVSSTAQNAISAKNIAQWDTIGGTWSLLGSSVQNGTNAAVYGLAVSGTDLYAGGIFTTGSSSTQNGISARSIAKWDTTGSTWSPLGSAAQNGVTRLVLAIAVSGSTVYVGGGFTTASSSTQNAIFSSRFGSFGPAPQITVEQPAGTVLQDGTASIAFGSQNLGSAGAPVTFTITNTGTADLTLGAISKDGANPGDFAASAPASTTLTAGNSTTFTVTFTPSAGGARSAAIHIASNVTGTTSPFDIALTGTGLDSVGPAGGTMTLTPASPVDASAALTVTFAAWNDPSTPLTYAVLVDDVVVSAQGASASRAITGPATPGAHTLKGRIYDALNNVTEVTQSFTVNTAIESWRQLHFGTTANSGDAADTFDYDKDGLVNLVEFAFGLLPKSGASLQLPQAQISDGNFVITFPQPAGVSGIIYGAEWCPELIAGDWHSVTDTGTGTLHTFSVPIGSNTRMFMRLTVKDP